jgi:hypothetical protein
MEEVCRNGIPSRYLAAIQTSGTRTCCGHTTMYDRLKSDRASDIFKKDDYFNAILRIPCRSVTFGNGIDSLCRSESGHFPFGHLIVSIWKAGEEAELCLDQNVVPPYPEQKYPECRSQISYIFARKINALKHYFADGALACSWVNIWHLTRF